MRKLPVRSIPCQHCGTIFFVTKKRVRTYCSRKCFLLKTTTHGEPDSSPEYMAWIGMKDRCMNPKNKRYSFYGGRGITVCEAWQMSFSQFLSDMGRRPSSSHSLDRINNALGYSPGNVRWATKVEQARNKRSNHLLSFNNITQCLSAWAEETGIRANTIKERLNIGWSVEDALTRPTGQWLRGEASLTAKNDGNNSPRHSQRSRRWHDSAAT